MGSLVYFLMNSPKTGDHRNIFLYVVLAAVALALILAYVIIGKISKKK